MFHNTTNETGETLKEYQKKAATQDDIIFDFMIREKKPYSPSDIHKILLPKAPITSIRRSLNTLTKKGALHKLEDKVKSPYDRAEHLWVIL